jgi:hypothetical protein
MMVGTLHSVDGISGAATATLAKARANRIFNRLALTLKPQSVLRIVVWLAV